ncbi:MAG: AbrB family transcriptional regulator [Pseudomonadota bacterium]|nr:AbrB family transcriptional regulator [Pseudomonadota bacterium]
MATSTAKSAGGDWQRRARIALALAVGSAGAALFLYLVLPLPWMLGSLAACLVAAIARLPVKGPSFLIAPARAILGLAVGAAFTPALIARLPEMAVSLAFIPPFVLLIAGLGVPFYRYVGRMDPATAFYSAMPGGFQDMIAMGRDAGAKERQLTLAHSARVLLIVFALPFWVEWSEHLQIGERAAAVQHWTGYDPLNVLVLLACAAAGWWAALKIGLSGAPLVGPMIACAAITISGFATLHLPSEVLNLAQLALGTHAGCQFAGVTWREFAGTVTTALAYTALLLGLTAAFSLVVVALTGLEQLPVVLAFSPGGQSEMNVIAIVLGADIAYVALHHLFRLAIVVLGAQVLYRVLNRRARKAMKD